jgi:protein-tyrosine phosphatase
MAEIDLVCCERCLDAEVEGAVNFRDLGGLPAAGGRVRRGLVYRSAMTHWISDDGLRALTHRYGLRSVLDLRAEQEIADEGLAPFATWGLTRHHASVIPQRVEPEEVRRERAAAMRENRYDWTASYQRMLRDGELAFRRLFELLAEPGALPAVFHCTAGRDRTGVAAALLLGLLGVDADAIARDYALSGRHLRPHAERFIPQSRRLQISAEQMAAILETSEEPMARFLALTTEEYGSARGYLERIGVSAATMDALRSALLEP